MSTLTHSPIHHAEPSPGNPQRAHSLSLAHSFVHSFYSPCCCKEERRVSSAVQTVDLPNSKVVDANGSPVMVSAVLNYQVVEPVKAMFDGETAGCLGAKGVIDTPN